MAHNVGPYPGSLRDKRDDNIHHVHSGATKAVAWLALLISVFSGVLAVNAYNRSGENLQSIVSRQFDEMQQDAELIAARTEARTRLIAIRAEVAAGQAPEETVREVSEIRRDLAEDYRDAGNQQRENWQQIDINLQRLEQQIRNKSGDAVGTLESTIGDLRREISTDENR